MRERLIEKWTENRIEAERNHIRPSPPFRTMSITEIERCASILEAIRGRLTSPTEIDAILSRLCSLYSLRERMFDRPFRHLLAEFGLPLDEKQRRERHRRDSATIGQMVQYGKISPAEREALTGWHDDIVHGDNLTANWE